MKLKLLILLILCFSCNSENEQEYIFFLHNKFIEEHSPDEKHQEYGKAEYSEIIKEFEKENFIVISEKRPGNTKVKQYASKVKKQIDSLLSKGIHPKKITVIGTSKGGYIAQYVSTFLKNPTVNFVFIGSFRESDIANYPEINYCGNILTIFEKTDELGVSAIARKESSNLEINHFKEIKLNTGLKHGFLFKPLKVWINPSIKWARQNYELN